MQAASDIRTACRSACKVWEFEKFKASGVEIVRNI